MRLPKTLHRSSLEAWLPWIALLAVAFVWVWVFPYSEQLNNPNERTRVLQAHALVWQGELSIGRLEPARWRPHASVDPWGERHHGLFVNDVSVRCDDPEAEAPQCAGDLFPAKGPGSALLAAPGLWVLRALGWSPEPSRDGERSLTRWSRLFGATLPCLVGLWLLAGFWERRRIPPGRIAALLLLAGLGTSIFPYAVMLVGHATAGVALLAGALWTSRGIVRNHAPYAAAGGAAIGAAVLLEYHSALAAVLVGLAVLAIRPGIRALAGFSLGAGAMGVLFATLHHQMFRHPLRTGHFSLVSDHNRESQAEGFLGLGGLHPDALVAHLVDPYVGLLPLHPWVVAALLGGVWLLLGAPGIRATDPPTPDERASEDDRWVLPLLVVIVTAYVLFLLTLGNWRVMNGWSIGPRYFLPALFPLVAIAGCAWHAVVRRAPPLEPVLAGLGAAAIVAMSAITLVYPQPPAWVRSPFGEIALPLLRAGWGVDSLGSVVSAGQMALAPVFLVVLLIVVWVIYSVSRGAPPPQRIRWLLLAGLAFTLWLAWLGSRAPTDASAREDAWRFIESTAEGARPPHARIP